MFPQFLQEAQDAGADALILADLGLLAMARKLAPDMEIHMSTQTGIVNYSTCRALYDMGVKRAVLARELSLEEIAGIRAKIPAEMELEVFVHGAMCMSFSGRCLLSAYLTGRDANRGACAQPCRWGYHLMEEKRPMPTSISWWNPNGRDSISPSRRPTKARTFSTPRTCAWWSISRNCWTPAWTA